MDFTLIQQLLQNDLPVKLQTGLEKNSDRKTIIDRQTVQQQFAILLELV